VRQWIEYVLYRILAFVVPLLPRRVMVLAGRRLGGLYMLLSPRTRATGRENLARVLPGRTDHDRILRDSLRLQGVALLDALWSVRLTPERARRYVGIEPGAAEMAREQLAPGRGAIVATAHFGSWEMFNLAARALGFPRATFIARAVNNPAIDRHLRKQRERNGNRLVYREQALPACIGALRRGEIVCSVIDMAVVPAEGGRFVEFLGTPALTSSALPLLAVRRNVGFVFAVCRPLDNGLRYQLELEKLDFDPDADRDAETRRLTRAMNEALERRVLEFPEAWIWGYKRWKSMPSELPGNYPSYALWVEPHY